MNYFNCNMVYLLPQHCAIVWRWFVDRLRNMVRNIISS